MATYFPQPGRPDTQNPLRIAENYRVNMMNQQQMARQKAVDRASATVNMIKSGSPENAKAIWDSYGFKEEMPQIKFAGPNLTFDIPMQDGSMMTLSAPKENMVNALTEMQNNPEAMQDPIGLWARHGISRSIKQTKAPAASELDKLLTEQRKHPEGSRPWQFYERRIKKITESRPQTQINLQTGPKPLIKEMSRELVVSQKDAEGAVVGLQNSLATKKILDEGMITGTGAEFLTSLGNLAASRLGFTEFEEPVSNAQAFAAAKGREVGQIIKQFGAGTGLSDADREYAEKIVGGKITLNEKSIRKIIEINNKAYRNVIERHNEKAKKAMEEYEGQLPYSLIVEMPKEAPTDITTMSDEELLRGLGL